MLAGLCGPAPGSGASPFNHFIAPDPDQLLRVSVAFGFDRGRLKSVYQVLRGKDLETGVFSPERRDQQFAVLKEAQSQVLDLKHWHQFLSALIGAGYRSGEMISSQNALLYAYAFYLIGTQKARATVGPWAVLALAGAAGVPVLLVCALMLGEPVVATDWTPVVVLAFTSQVIGQGLLVFSLRHFSPLVVGLALLTQPAVGALVGWLSFGEIVTPLDMGGMALLGLALVLARAGRPAGN